MKLNKLLEAINDLSDDGTVKTFDITTKEGYEGFKETIKSLRENKSNELFKSLGIDFDELMDNLSKLGEKIYNDSNKIKRKEIDHTEGKEFKRPSELLSVDKKLQLHKLVQEYVDTTIKPFNNGVLSNDQINDAYAGLYEFGAWILNR